MILVDSLFINDGGGKVLLKYFSSQLKENLNSVDYLVDSRLNLKDLPDIKSYNILKPRYLLRFFYLKKKSKNYDIVFSMGNLPPSNKIKSLSITYLHSSYYIEDPKYLSLKNKIINILKQLIFRFTQKNTDIWMVQTNLMKFKLAKKYNISSNKILVLPFFEPYEKGLITDKKKLTFLYVSNATIHKNHERLINAFCRYYDKNMKGELILTVSHVYKKIVDIINEKVEKNYPIINIGFVDKENLNKIFMSSEFFIFPSLTESFGLGLAEAIQYNCKVISSNLPYVYEICDPSLTFDPISEDSISEAFEFATNNPLPFSRIKVENKIFDIINILKTGKI